MGTLFPCPDGSSGVFDYLDDYCNGGNSTGEDFLGTDTQSRLFTVLTWVIIVYVFASAAALMVLFSTGWIDQRLNVNTRYIDAHIRRTIENELLSLLTRNNLYNGSPHAPTITPAIARGNTIARLLARERYLWMTEPRNTEHNSVMQPEYPWRVITVHRGPMPTTYPLRTSSVDALSRTGATAAGVPV